MSQASVNAVVSGSKHYEVKLTILDCELLASCTCPYFGSEGNLCKHIWATILAADMRQFACNAKVKHLVSRVVDDDSEDDHDHDDHHNRRGSTYQPPVNTPKAPAPIREAWKEQISQVLKFVQPSAPINPLVLATEQQLIFVLDLPASVAANHLVLEIHVQVRKLNGEWGKPTAKTLNSTILAQMNDPLGKQIFDLMNGAGRTDPYGYGTSHFSYGVQRYRLSGPLASVVLPLLLEPGRFLLRREAKSRELEPLVGDLEPPWEIEVSLAENREAGKLVLSGSLRRGEQTMLLTLPQLINDSTILCDGRISRLVRSEAFAWVDAFRRKGPIEVPIEKAEEFLSQLMQAPSLPGLTLPENLRYAEVAVAPQPQVAVKPPKQTHYRGRGLLVDLSFNYEGHVVPPLPWNRGIFDRENRRFLLRNAEVEQAAMNELRRRGVQLGWSGGEQSLVLESSRLPKFVRELVAAGWQVKAEGKLYRQASAFSMAVRSTRDWFDLDAQADFEGTSVALPRLLEALKRGDSSVVLDDGTHGMLPEEWLQKWGLLARMGLIEGDAVRFSRAQVGVLDALLASRPEVTFDKQFEKARGELRKFTGVTPSDPPAAFKGELREYQREGLGWLQFLRKFGFGGCLADDMGLGKTVQVLAFLAGRRKGTTLVVVPKSLVFNWKQEATRFAPKLKVLDHTGLTRDRSGGTFKDHDIVITTYGTLRNDISAFTTLRFDTCVLDESQAAKNSETETAKAVRLIQADHRLALSGTPVENHLGELWTLFEFLNPGMLGHSGLFGTGIGNARNADLETRQLLAQALRPFILRRTKDQVAKDLPAKTEQTLYCDLESEQRQLYDELREHYRQSLLARVNKLGLKRSKIQVLEALLRLRQAACHPGLIDKSRSAQSSAKLDVLLPQLQELAEEGHKALVFSQFTSFLAILRSRLDKLGITYEYLDGRTRDRAERVERFQTDANCKLFLVSLKAGGVGLNLTAAEYVFLLDPWWNPAVEAQAIDRSHRIGQTRPVFAYRLIARNTVEEKVLALQETKRELANAILSGEGRLITDLNREDLELLLS